MLLVGARRALIKRPAVIIAGGSDASETTAFIARADALTTLNSTYRPAYKDLINYLVAQSVLSDMYRLVLTGSQTEAIGLLFINTTGSATKTGSPAFTANRGHSSISDTAYIDLGWSPDDGTNFSTDGCFGAWVRAGEGGTGVSYYNFIGCDANETHISGLDGADSTHVYGRFEHATWEGGPISTVQTDVAGFWTNDVTGTTEQLYKNGSAIGSPYTVQFPSLHTTNFTNKANNTSGRGEAALFVSKHLNSTKQAALYTAIAAFYTAVNGGAP